MRHESHWRAIVMAILAAVFARGVSGQQAMNAMKPKHTEQSGFEVIGIESRTNNSKESCADGAIPKQWQRLFKEDLPGRVPDRLDQSIIAVYTN
jgi:hypothetical protein